jgi:chloramphenicol 3-O phosphotransferase
LARAVVLNGGSSSGKSSIALCLQELLDEPWARLGVDDLVGPGWRPVESAWYRGVAAMARAGLGVIVEEVLLDGGAGQRRVAGLLGDVAVVWVGVLCRVEVAAGREARRGDRVAGMAADQAVRVHEGVRYDVTVDTSSSSPEECARQIAAQIARTESRPLATLALRSRSAELRRACVDDVPASSRSSRPTRSGARASAPTTRAGTDRRFRLSTTTRASCWWSPSPRARSSRPAS